MNYTTNELLDRVYCTLSKLNIQKNKKLKLILPNVKYNEKRRRTYINNFKQLCKCLDRDIQLVQSFICSELLENVNDSSINDYGQLIIKGRYNTKDIINIIVKFTKKYIQCYQCKSSNTDIIKNKKIKSLYCRSCLSTQTI